MKYLLWYIFILIFLCKSLLAQIDTSIYIQDIEIVANSIRQKAVGGLKESFTSTQLKVHQASNVAEFLQQETGMYIKGYGLGSLSTSSIRGGSAGHTVVLWNDLPIESPMLGLLDLALLPVQSFDQINIEKGGQSALWGSGAIGGVISLNNARTENENSIYLGSSIGSFGTQNLNAGLIYKHGKLLSQTKWSRHESTNDFEYEVGSVEKRLANATVKRDDLHQNIYFDLNNRNNIQFHFWHQDVERQIPPSTTQSMSMAYQEDSSNRLMFKWSRVGAKSLFNYSMAYFAEELNYFDPVINLSSPSQFNSLIIDLNTEWQVSSAGIFSVGMSHRSTSADASAYRDIITENRTALFGSVKWIKPRLQLQASIREELVAGEFIPLTPTVGFSYQLSSVISLKGKLSRNYRLATMNDRYWRPGGNVALKPESGWSQEISSIFDKNNNSSQLKASATLYSRHIENWILWSITNNQNYFSANNLAKVWSRGLETNVSHTKTINESVLTFKLAYNYTKSTNEIEISQPKLDKGDQLIYTPEHTAYISAYLKRKVFSIQYHHQYVGASSGINEDVDAYQVGNIRLQTEYTIEFSVDRTMTFEPFFHLFNLWDTSYRVIERRPMPGRYFLVGVSLNFNP